MTLSRVFATIALIFFFTFLSKGQALQTAKLFSYDRSIAFDMKEISSKKQDGVIIRDVDYAAYTSRRGRIKAYIVTPGGKGPFAGVLFFHWLGKPNGDRTQFLDEAVTLANKGVVSLLIQGYFPWSVDPTDGQTDRQLVIDETIEVRRALDLLLSQPQIDRKRMGYVGHDYGAMYGSVLAGVDKRVKIYVLIAGTGSFSDWSLGYWLKTKPTDFKASYRQAFETIEPVRLIGRAAPAAVLFQFANSDKFIRREAAMAFYNAASQSKQVKWYDTIHEMNLRAARTDRGEWLTQKLGLVRKEN